jgi:hypothetical protein
MHFYSDLLLVYGLQLNTIQINPLVWIPLFDSIVTIRECDLMFFVLFSCQLVKSYNCNHMCVQLSVHAHERK